mmetsp:Transcript_31778/g.98163  ORF Transcript_31778/g.98163 Transcript_31778/m.98163 type:complete len:119 (-) Transcript_31778:73-429(-)
MLRDIEREHLKQLHLYKHQQLLSMTPDDWRKQVAQLDDDQFSAFFVAKQAPTKDKKKAVDAFMGKLEMGKSDLIDQLITSFKAKSWYVKPDGTIHVTEKVTQRPLMEIMPFLSAMMGN